LSQIFKLVCLSIPHSFSSLPTMTDTVKKIKTGNSTKGSGSKSMKASKTSTSKAPKKAGKKGKKRQHEDTSEDEQNDKPPVKKARMKDVQAADNPKVKDMAFKANYPGMTDQEILGALLFLH
jgi:hypothetical protein